MTHLTTIDFLYQNLHPKDGWTTGLNTLVKILEIKCITKLKCICWFLIHFIYLINARNMKYIKIYLVFE